MPRGVYVRSAAYREKQRQAMIRQWADPVARAQRSAAIAAGNQSPAFRQAMREHSIAVWASGRRKPPTHKRPGPCDICGTISRGSLHRDHDHVTGQRRGLLCFSCNMALGLFKDDPVLLRRAANYLDGGIA